MTPLHCANLLRLLGLLLLQRHLRPQSHVLLICHHAMLGQLQLGLFKLLVQPLLPGQSFLLGQSSLLERQLVLLSSRLLSLKGRLMLAGQLLLLLQLLISRRLLLQLQLLRLLL